MSYKRIVAGTDLSKTAKFATDRAAALARRTGAELILVHAGGKEGPELDRLAEEYGAAFTLTPAGTPAEVLIDVTQEVGADLLVVGSVGMSGARRFMLGNVPNKVSHHGMSDLLIVKTNPPPTEVGDYRGILVGTDGSDTAMRAVDMAAELSKALATRLLAVCAYEPPTGQELKAYRASSEDVMAQWSAGSEFADVPEEFRWRIAGASQAEDVLERAIDHAAMHGADAEAKAMEGNAAEVLIYLAQVEECDLIVVGNVGMSGAKRFTLGNVPHRISHHAPTDVLILRTA